MRSSFLLLSMLVVASAACADSEASAPPTPSSTQPTSSAPTGGGATTTTSDDEPSGGDRTQGAGGNVLEVSHIGGDRAPDAAILDVPVLIVSDDGRLIERVKGYDEPALVPGYEERTISEDGVAKIVNLAESHALLSQIEYADDPATRPPDAQSTIVALSVAGTTYEHGAYALELDLDGPYAETDPARLALARFVVATGDLATVVGRDELGEPERFAADRYVLRARPSTDQSLDGTTDWPTDAGVALAQAAECVEVDGATEAAEAIEAADNGDRFSDGGAVYDLTVAPGLPGHAC